MEMDFPAASVRRSEQGADSRGTRSPGDKSLASRSRLVQGREADVALLPGNGDLGTGLEPLLGCF